MKLNQFTDLGMRTLIYLTQPPRATPFTIGEIAQDINVSKNHLVKVVHFMTRQGWVKTTLGRNGGIALAHEPASYPLGSTVKTLEGHIDGSDALVNCDHPACILKANCHLRAILSDALSQFYSYLDGYTLADAINNPHTLIQLWRL